MEDLEQAGWSALSRGDGPAFYERVMADDAVIVVPGMVLDKEQTLASWGAETPPWAEFDLRDWRTLELGPHHRLVTYAATARRDGDESPYRAQCTSVYASRTGDWRLVFHQQTPVPERETGAP